MDELSRTRTELERLEKKERDLQKQLSSVRMEIEVYKSRIESLVRTKPAPINSLPPEILSYVFDLTLWGSVGRFSSRSKSGMHIVAGFR